ADENESQASTSVALGTSNASTAFGQSVMLTATVSVTAPGAGTPTGNVNFMDGATLLQSVAVNGGGVATLTLSSLTVATHSITAVYVGDTNFAGSTSNTVSQTVNA